MPVKQMTLAEIEEYIQPPAPRGIDEIVLHHFWNPTLAQYKGLSTWEGVRAYHMNGRGWSDIGYHFGADAQGRYWRCRDYRKSGAHVLNRNAHTIGVAIPGNFDVEDPSDSLEVAARLVRVVVDRFKLTPGAIRFHREFQDKSCPGLRCDLTLFRRMVTGVTTVPEVPDEWPTVPALAVVLDGQIVPCVPKMVGGRLAVLGAPFVTALGVALPGDLVHASGYMMIHEAAEFFEQQGWIIDGRVWRNEALPGGVTAQRLYPQRVEWV